MSVEPGFPFEWSRTTPPARPRLVLVGPPPHRMRSWLWAWVLWLMVAAAAPPVGLVVGLVLVLGNKVLGAVMITVATISAIWIAAAYFAR